MPNEFMSKEMPETRICKDCSQEKPLSSFTHKGKRGVSYTQICFTCKGKRARRRKGISPINSPYFCEKNNSLVKNCVACKVIKLISEFSTEQSKCKPCLTEYQKQWQRNNYEKIKNRNKKRFELMSDEEKQRYLLKQKEWAKKWYLSGGKNYILELQKTDKYRKYGREWKSKRTPKKKKQDYWRNRESYRKRASKRRALESNCNLIIPYTKTEIIRRDGLNCYLCEKVLTNEQVTLDHIIPISKGGNDKAENIKISCKSCNSSKRDKTLTEFKKWRGDYNFRFHGENMPRIAETALISIK